MRITRMITGSSRAGLKARTTAVALAAIALTAMLQAASDPPATLAEAASAGDKAAVRSMLKDGADVNAAQGDGMTALHVAALNGDVELANMLVYAGANVRATTRLGGYTPLLMAAKNGDTAMIEALVKGGADVSTATTAGTTPLMFAAASGKVDAVKFLLDKGADLKVTESSRGESALTFAAANGRTDVVKLLVSRGADVKATTKVVDLSAFTREEQERFAAIVATGAPPQPKGAEPAGFKPEGQEAPAKEATPAKESEPKPEATEAKAAPAKPAPAKPAAPARKPQVAGVDRQYLYNELVGHMGGMTPLLLAARSGQLDTVKALVDAGADVNQVSGGDHTSPLLIATINGQFDTAKYLLEKGADPNLASENGATPLYGAINVQWAPKALYPQPRAYEQQHITYLDMMKALLDKGADPNVRLARKIWYSGYNFDLSGVDEIGATPFWRSAYGADIDAMKILVAHGADPNIPTMKPAGRPRTGDAAREVKDTSGLPPVPVGGPGVPALVAVAGVGYAEGFAANSHRYAPTGMLAAVKYLVEELHADVNATDHEGNTALHNAASRGDNEMILYLISKGANVMAVNRSGLTTVDMANGPVQRTQPYPETIALLEKLGAKNNHKCVSCD